MICLDTNAVIATINRRVPEVRRRLEAAFVQGLIVGIPTIVIYELWYGIRKSAHPQANAARLAAFLSLDVETWPFEPADAEEAGEIRATLDAAGAPIGPYDTLIAAQARRRAALLVTANTGEFDRVSGLKTENWAAD
jgi:tRNA(fMet)-specific endonuclease VapC